MTKKVKISVSDFSMVYTPYEFAHLYASRMDIKDKLTSAKIERHQCGYWQVTMKFKKEAHALSLNEVAEFLDVHYVMCGTLADGTNVLCAIE